MQSKETLSKDLETIKLNSLKSEEEEEKDSLNVTASVGWKFRHNKVRNVTIKSWNSVQNTVNLANAFSP